MSETQDFPWQRIHVEAIKKDGDRTAVKDPEEGWLSTFDKSLAAPLEEGKSFEIKYVSKPSKDGTRTFKNLTAVREIEQNGAQPKLGDGSYIKGQEHPGKQRSIHADVALQQAVATLSHTIKTDSKPEEVAERVLPLASRYFAWLLQRTGLETDQDIPF